MPVKTIGDAPVGVYRAPAYGQSGRSVVIMNTDKTNPVYYADSPTIDNGSSYVPPLGIEVFDGGNDVWMSTLNSAVSVAVQLKIGSSAFSSGEISITGNVDATVNGDVTVTGQTVALDVSAASVPVNGNVGTLANVNLLGTIPFVPAGSNSNATFSLPATAEGYEIILAGQILIGYVFVTDVTVEHLDSNGSAICVETFTVSNYPIINRGRAFYQPIVRGRILGTKINVGLNVASASWITTVTGAASITASPVQANVYALPSYNHDESQITPALKDRALLTGSLISLSANDTTFGTLLPYEGKARYSFYNDMASTGPTLQGDFQSFSVANGTSPVQIFRTPYVAPKTCLTEDIALDNYLHVLAVYYVSGSGSGGVIVSVNAYN